MLRKPGVPFAAFALTLVLTACATMSPDYDEPVVTLAGFSPVSAEGMVPAFEIKLRILNPNDFDLELKGIAYTISIEDHDLVKGVGKDIPVIEAYSEEVVTLTGSASFISGVRLFTDLARSQGGATGLDYAFEAKLDLAGPYPTIRIRESGRLGEAREGAE